MLVIYAQTSDGINASGLGFFLMMTETMALKYFRLVVLACALSIQVAVANDECKNRPAPDAKTGRMIGLF